MVRAKTKNNWHSRRKCYHDVVACRLSNKLSILFEPHHVRQICSHFQTLKSIPDTKTIELTYHFQVRAVVTHRSNTWALDCW